MKGQAVDQIVYEYMFPKPKSTDPQNFHAFLQRNLIPEVRQETHAFYGHLETQEAKYPGLDYTHNTHRIRLSRWPWHRRLFRAFDNLRLTDSEIAGLTKWEGTKWAKDKFEREEGITIRDTTADDFPDWVEPAERPRTRTTAPITTRTTTSTAPATGTVHIIDVDSIDDEDDRLDEEDSDEELESVGAELNERLRAQVARREAGDNVVLDEAWEQWLKNAIESGELTFLTEHITDELFQRASASTGISAALIPPAMISAARAGQWSEIPESLQPMLRRTLNLEASTTRVPPTDSPGRPVGANTSRRHFLDDARSSRSQQWSAYVSDAPNTAARG
ncbi:hypothetical protein HJFPF1_01741 [Paramyrothecium foliicola]|nr:hypothetical protein HJFPF1_01741 [Paramyrothecium foliicola]